MKKINPVKTPDDLLIRCSIGRNGIIEDVDRGLIMITNEDRINGAILGCAYGDAWGEEAEFRSYQENRALNEPFPQLARITDDTQMSLYTSYGLEELWNDNKISLESQDDETKARRAFAHQFIKFFHDPDNNRAPGKTCLTAIAEYESSYSAMSNGLEGTRLDSKGCGANMRTGWLGLAPLSEHEAILLSVIQAEVTHGHGNALAASALTTGVVWNLMWNNDRVPKDGIEFLRWLKYLATKYDLASEDVFTWRNKRISRGFYEIQIMLQKAINHYDDFVANDNSDICNYFGQGWVADEALILAAAAFARYNTDPVAGLKRLIISQGDSDSIAAIGGGFFGVNSGISAFDESWHDRLETRYKKELSEVALFYTSML